MKEALEKLRKSVFQLSDKYGHSGKRRELEELFNLLETELDRGPLQSQRIMSLLRYIMARQPGASKHVNEFLRHPEISKVMHQSGLTLG